MAHLKAFSEMQGVRVHPSLARQWFAICAPPVAFCAHELASFYVSFEICREGRPALARSVLEALAVAALTLSLSGLTVGLLEWRRTSGRLPLAENEAETRPEMLAIVGLAIGLLFFVALLWGALPSLLLHDPCETRA